MAFTRLLLFLSIKSKSRSSPSSSICRSIFMVKEFASVDPSRYRWNVPRALFSTSSADEAQSVESADPSLDFVTKQIQELETQDAENQQEVEKEKEKEVASCFDTERGRGISSEHPWPEWSALMEELVRNDYFKTFADDDDDDGGGDNGRSMLKDFNHVRNACLNFGRDRFDILRSLSKEDIQKIVQYGCPSIDRKVVNSGKRLRSYLNIEEGDVCSKCNIRGSCDRAYISAPKEESARTVDVMRILLTYGLDQIFDSVENKLHTKKTVKSSICKLLKEVVELSATPLDPNLPLPIPRPTIKQALAPPIKQRARTDVEMKLGDWLCPRCNIINFARNTVCIECDEKRPNNLKGEWECPDCNFVNFSRNIKCLKCDCKRPKYEKMEIENELNPGDWKCPKCNFLNFRRNTTCLECDSKCPKDDNVDIGYILHAGDWKCPECRFLNFGRNKRCLKCECKCPNDNKKIARELTARDWKCPGCGFMNFGRNMVCLKCECKCPNDDNSRQINPGDWKCPECKFPNFGRNMACLKCKCKRPKDVHSEIGSQSDNDCWTDDISGLQEFKHVSRRSSGQDRSSSSGFNTNDFSDLDLDDFDDDRSEYKQKRAGSGRSSDRYDGSSTSATKDGGSSEDDNDFNEFPVRGGKSEITGGRTSRLKGNKNPSHWSSGIDRSLSSRDIANDDDDIDYNMKREHGVKPSGMASHRQCGLSTSPRGKEKAYKYDESDDEDGSFGSHHRKELGSSKRFSSAKPKTVTKSSNFFGDLDNDDDVGYDMKKANSKESSGRAYNRFASSASAKEKQMANNYDNTDDEDDWFGDYKSEITGGRKSQLRGNNNPRHWSSGVDRSLSSRDIANDDDGIGYNVKRADGVKPSGMTSHRQRGPSTSLRGKEKASEYDETDDEDGWFGTHHEKDLGSSKRFSSIKSKSVMNSSNVFGDLDNDDGVVNDMKRANSKKSSGRT